MMSMSPLEREIRRRIADTGPMPVSEYMALCLGHPQHGYYMTRDPFGARRDFVTAPEVSQMFGELLGLWTAAVWQQMGAPQGVRVVELGPGRGTLMSDALRAARLMPGFLDAISVHLVEISPVLKATQQETLRAAGAPLSWHTSLAEVPDGPIVVFANEFFDALPIDQAVKAEDGWHERRVGIDGDDRLAFVRAPAAIAGFERLLPPGAHDAPPGAVFEWRDLSLVLALGRRLAQQGGAALVIDYGHSATGLGETLQAVSGHAFAHPLEAPGERDLTAHVDFAALIRAAETNGAAGFGPLAQGEFLRRLGIETRAAKLKSTASSAARSAIDAALTRLTGDGPGDMGRLFKVAAFAHPALGALPGFLV
jgi:SAM-dependent MidA family methyltransferase